MPTIAEQVAEKFIDFVLPKVKDREVFEVSRFGIHVEAVELQAFLTLLESDPQKNARHVLERLFGTKWFTDETFRMESQYTGDIDCGSDYIKDMTRCIQGLRRNTKVPKEHHQIDDLL